MAQKFLSPGVFTTEVDESFLAQGVAGIGAVVVGRTLKGPANVPVFSNGFDAFAARFGATSPSLQLPYAARNYLRNSTSLTTVRVLGHADGTTVTNGYTINGAISGITDAAAGQVLAEIHHTGSTTALTVIGVSASATDFVVRINTGTTVFAATASFVPTAANYIEKVLNTDPTKYSTYGHYIYRLMKHAKPAASASWGDVVASGTPTSFAKDFSGGSTPFVKSQPVGGLEFDLFKFHTMSHGRATNDEIKVAIQNVKPSISPAATPFGTFDVVVRKFDDTDQRPTVLETFSGCTLDPDAPGFILRKIGDMNEEFSTSQRKFVSSGTWPNKSRHVRVELSTGVNAPAEALPFGHRGFSKLTFTTGAVPAIPLVLNQKDKQGNVDLNIAWGVSFVSGGIADHMRTFPVSAVTNLGTEFSLSFLSSSLVSNKKTWAYNPTLLPVAQHQPTFASASLYKFNLPLQGGFDGWDLRLADPLNLGNGITDISTSGHVAGTGGGHAVVSLKRALDTVANPDAFDMNILAVPGVHNLKVVDHARSLVNERRDVMLVMDITGSSVSEAVNLLKAREIDDNYTACYYPDLKLTDRTANRVVRVAPSVAVLGAIAYSDRVGQVFFAPAGLNRGGLSQFDITDTADRLNFQDRNDLYDNRINPIASFPNEGIVVFGQKTLQVKASALDRVNVRRLLIFAKKTVASASKYLLFEPNNPSTWQRFTNLVNPIFEKIRQDQGIQRFKVVMDTSTNTPDLIDRNTMAGKIFLEPTKVGEFIDLSFVITATGVAFGE